MSYDRLLDQVCPHLVVEEALFLQQRQVVRPLRPIAASGSLRVRLDSEMDVPSPGVHIPATATGTKAGPYNIQGGVNDTLVFQVNDGAIQTVTLPSGNQVSTDKVAERLNRVTQDAVFASTSRRYLRIKSSYVGPASTIFVYGSSTAASLLGLSVNRAWRGQTVAPGWSLVNDPNTLRDRPTRLIVFDAPLKGSDDFVEINYTTIRQECRRCGGLGVENDWRYGSAGDLIKVRDENLLIQELLKATYTLQGSNPFHLWYGTQIMDTIGRKLSSTGIVQNMIVSDIHEAFRRWQMVKKQQEEDVGQQVSDEEYPFRLLSVSLQQSDQDPTIIFVSASVQNRSNKPIQIERGLRVPLPMDLLGSTQQSSLFNQTLPNYNLVE